MIEALKDKPATPFRVPPGIRLVRVDYMTGERAGPGAEKVILEAFKPGTEPTGVQALIQGVTNYGQDAGYGSIIPLGTSGEGYQGGTMIIDSTGAYGTDPTGGGVVSGTASQPVPPQGTDPGQTGVVPGTLPGTATTSPDGSVTIDPGALEPTVQPTGPNSGTVVSPDQNAGQPAQQPPAPDAAPLQPAPAPAPQPAAPATDSSGGIY